MDNGICELNIDELDTVVGGVDLDGYKECPFGTHAGGNAGVYPTNVDCADSPGMGDLIAAFKAGFVSGGGTFSGGGSGSGGSPA